MCCVSAAVLMAVGCSRTDAPRADGSATGGSPSISSTWFTTTSGPATSSTSPVASAGGAVDFAVSGAWVVRTDRATGESQPWIHLDRLPELSGLDQFQATVDVSHDGSLLAVVVSGWLADLDSTEVTSEVFLASTERPDDIRRVESGVDTPGVASLSPDRRWLAVFGDGRLSLVPVEGGPAVPATIDAPLPYPTKATWSTDGRRLTVLSGTNRGQTATVAFEVDPATGVARTE